MQLIGNKKSHFSATKRHNKKNIPRTRHAISLILRMFKSSRTSMSETQKFQSVP